MNIASALACQKALSEEIARLRRLDEKDAWSYRTTTADAEWKPNFDIEKNHDRVKQLVRLHARLGQAISRTNLEVDVIGISDEDFKDWF